MLANLLQILGKAYDETNEFIGYKVIAVLDDGRVERIVTEDTLREECSQQKVYYNKLTPLSFKQVKELELDDIVIKDPWMHEQPLSKRIKTVESLKLRSLLVKSGLFDYVISGAGEIILAKAYSEGCSKKFVVHPVFDQIMHGAFSGCDFTEVYINNREDKFFSASGIFSWTNSKTLKVRFKHPEMVNNTSLMFYRSQKLQEIDLGDFTGENVTDMTWMFCDCEVLLKLDLSKFDTRKVTSMESMFAHCNNLTRLDLSSFYTPSLIEANRMFNWCERLSYVNLSHFDTSSVVTMQEMFASCESLRKLDLPNFTLGKKVDLEEMFIDCESLADLDISGMDTRGKQIGVSGMFDGCADLISLKSTDESILFAFRNREIQ